MSAYCTAWLILFCGCSYRDFIGFALGLASIATWMVAQFPQIYSNIKNRSAEALSAWFLAEWLMVGLSAKLYPLSHNMLRQGSLWCVRPSQGDTCNLIGCLLTGDQLVTQTYTAMCDPTDSCDTMIKRGTSMSHQALHGH